MPYVATIQRMSDGATKDVPRSGDWDNWDATERFIWEDGNYACDCNRSLFFGDPHPGEEGICCGSGRYQVRITLPDGSVPYDEITPQS